MTLEDAAERGKRAVASGATFTRLRHQQTWPVEPLLRCLKSLQLRKYNRLRPNRWVWGSPTDWWRNCHWPNHHGVGPWRSVIKLYDSTHSRMLGRNSDDLGSVKLVFCWNLNEMSRNTAETGFETIDHLATCHYDWGEISNEPLEIHLFSSDDLPCFDCRNGGVMPKKHLPK